jgi:hypothetical protein
VSQHWPRIPSWWQHFDLLDIPKPFSIIELDKILATCTFFNVQSRNSTCLDISSLFPKFHLPQLVPNAFLESWKNVSKSTTNFFPKSNNGQNCKGVHNPISPMLYTMDINNYEKNKLNLNLDGNTYATTLKTLTPLAPK